MAGTPSSAPAGATIGVGSADFHDEMADGAEAAGFVARPFGDGVPSAAAGFEGGAMGVVAVLAVVAGPGEAAAGFACEPVGVEIVGRGGSGSIALRSGF